MQFRAKRFFARKLEKRRTNGAAILLAGFAIFLGEMIKSCLKCCQLFIGENIWKAKIILKKIRPSRKKIFRSSKRKIFARIFFHRDFLSAKKKAFARLKMFRSKFFQEQPTRSSANLAAENPRSQIFCSTFCRQEAAQFFLAEKMFRNFRSRKKNNFANPRKSFFKILMNRSILRCA